MAKHTHCELIKAWADGASIQYQSPVNGEWRDTEFLSWDVNKQYRIKPKEKIKYTEIEVDDDTPNETSCCCCKK